MKVVFQLRFHTKFGQDLFITGDHDLFGTNDNSRLVPLHYKDPENWEASLTIPDAALPDTEITYNYVLREPDGSTIQDWGNDRKLNPAKFSGQNIFIADSWNYAGFYENAFYTEPFQQVLLKESAPSHAVPAQAMPAATHRFCAKAPLLEPGQALCILGSSPGLGSWSTANPVRMHRVAGDPYWQADLSLPDHPTEYKYGIYDLSQKAFVRFESGKNRVLPGYPSDTNLSIIRDGFAVLPSTTWKGAGVAIPVFSLRSERSFGIGEFSDLQLLADWCAATGMQLIQVLPVNDTSATHTWRDSYPYAAISAFALNPVYLRLEGIATQPSSRATLVELESERAHLNSLGTVDYEAVARAKRKFIERVFPAEKGATFASSDYRRFFETNRHWLTPYALFCCLRDKYNTSDFNRWPVFSTYDPTTAGSVATEPGFNDGVERVYFTQYHLHRQLQEAAKHAHQNGVILKGDIPIGIYRYGADAWQAPDLYHMDMQAGAPPDAFAVKGQNWSFPTYNWPRMQQDGFTWWKQRFSQMSGCFDAFRIDHILGFFRIWSIPLHAVEGILGYFVPALPVHGREFLQRGIPFSRERFVDPFITEEVLAELFGNDAPKVASMFLDQDRFGAFTLKESFKTQRQVQLALPGQDEQSTRWRQGLFDLISNVILLDIDETGDEFHFRFGIEQTSSFKALPTEVQAPLRELYVDYFYRRQDAFWADEALKKLPALKHVMNMLVCGEDLGMVPACVPHVMRDLGLLSLEVQRMPKDPGLRFSNPANAPYLSVVTPSTHDMNTIRGWWEEDPAITQDFYNHELGLPGKAPADCESIINELIVLQHLKSPAMWSIFMLQDLLGSDARLRHPNPGAERINVPAIPEYHWRYRMHLSLESLFAETAFNNQLKSAVVQSGRGPRSNLPTTPAT